MLVALRCGCRRLARSGRSALLGSVPGVATQVFLAACYLCAPVQPTVAPHVLDRGGVVSAAVVRSALLSKPVCAGGQWPLYWLSAFGVGAAGPTLKDEAGVFCGEAFSRKASVTRGKTPSGPCEGPSPNPRTQMEGAGDDGEAGGVSSKICWREYSRSRL